MSNSSITLINAQRLVTRDTRAVWDVGYSNKSSSSTQLKILSISSVADGRMKQKSDFSVGFLTRRLATNKTSCIVRGLQYTIMCDFRSAITA